MDVSSREFAAHPSLFLRKAQAGETIVVTEEGRAIAELRPMKVPADNEESALLALVSSGLVTAPTYKRTSPSPPLRLAGPPVSEALLEDRKDRF